TKTHDPSRPTPTRHPTQAPTAPPAIPHQPATPRERPDATPATPWPSDRPSAGAPPAGALSKLLLPWSTLSLHKSSVASFTFHRRCVGPLGPHAPATNLLQTFDYALISPGSAATFRLVISSAAGDHIVVRDGSSGRNR